MAIFNFWGRHQKQDYHLSDEEALTLLQQLESRAVPEKASTPLKTALLNQLLLNNPKLKGRQLYLSHYTEYVLLVVDHAFKWLRSSSELCSDAVKLLEQSRMMLARAAFEDEGVLSDSDHPLCHYFNRVLSHMVGSESMEQDHYLLALKKCLQAHKSFVSMDNSGLEALQSWQQREQRRVDLTAHRIKSVITHKLKAEKAQTITEQVIGELLEIYKVPVNLKRLITLWQFYLQALFLDEQIDRQTWQLHLNDLADILSYINNMVHDGPHAPIERSRLDKHRALIKSAMDYVQYAEARRAPLLNAFDKLYESLANRQTISMVRVVIKERFQCDTDFDMGLMVPDEKRHIEGLRVGDWLEFTLSPDDKVRMQLIAKIQETASLIFLRRRGAAIVEKRFSDLALGIETNTIRRLDAGEQMFTEALAAGIKGAGGVCRRVRTMVG